MDRIKNLGRYQKTILILLCVMVVVFTVVYAVVSTRVGFEYQDTILLPRKEGSDTVYTGIIAAERITITVTEDRSVTFYCGDKVYGPYTVKEDPAAIPEDDNKEIYTAGIEVCEGDSVYFRGGVIRLRDNDFLLYSEDGSDSSMDFYYTDSNGITMDMDGNVIDFMKPTVSTILELLNEPELTSKGEWSVWFFGVFFAICCGLFVLFADELYLLSLSLRVRNPEYAEPSDFEVIGRYISWTALTIGTFILFVIGLT